jgi:PPOX class probable F420-dependent enzyme
MAEMTGTEIEALLALPNIAVLSTADAAARPEGSPVWYAHDAGTFRILVHRDSRKARNIRANAQVSLVIDTRSAPYRGVIVRGTATLSGPDPVLRRYLAMRYLGAETGSRYLEASNHLDVEDALVTIRTTSRHSWDYSKGM